MRRKYCQPQLWRGMVRKIFQYEKQINVYQQNENDRYGAKTLHGIVLIEVKSKK